MILVEIMLKLLSTLLRCDFVGGMPKKTSENKQGWDKVLKLNISASVALCVKPGLVLTG